jgi:hypothetical protein
VCDSAAEEARTLVATVRDDPEGRVRLMASLYRTESGDRSKHLPYRRAAMAFMGWQQTRGVLNPVRVDHEPGASDHSAKPGGSPWWRAVNERLLTDTAEGRASLSHVNAQPSTPSAEMAAHFARNPTARNWYRAHNSSVVAGYLEHAELAAREDRVERFFLNLVLVRVLFAHALVAAPRTALARAAPVAPFLGDPRVGMTGIFLSLSRVLPDSYPLGDDLDPYVANEHGFGRLLDIGVIRPRIRELFEWSAAELDNARLMSLIDGDIPVYAWDAADDTAWNQSPSRAATLVRRVTGPRKS